MSRILIVEDEPRIVAFLTKGLKAAGFTTHTTAEGGQAVALAVQEDFDLRLTHRDMVLDLRTRTLTLEGRTVELSAREFALAETFMRHPGQVLSREQLLSAVWGLDFDPGSNVVEVYVSYLRNKLGRQRVETVRGMGYRLI